MVCHARTTQLKAMVEAPFTAATTASKLLFIILTSRPATFPRWKLRVSYQTASSVLETSTCRLMMSAWQLHMTSPWSRLLWNRPLSSSARSVGFAADAAERRKAIHYANNCASQGIRFIPLAQGTLGGWSTQAGKILSLLADHIADRKGLQRATCCSALLRELGIAT
jgi:hypothetical protein